MKKKIFTMLLLFTICFTLVGCGSEEKELPIDKELPINELWGKLKGYWSDEEKSKFVCFSYEEMNETYFAGIWNAGAGRGAGIIKNVEYQKNDVYKLTVYYPANLENEIDGPYEELTTTVIVNISDINNNKITVNDNNNGNVIYTLSGRTYEEATK